MSAAPPAAAPREGAARENPRLRLSLLDEVLAICRLAAGAEVPGWALASSFMAVVRTHRELSVVCAQHCVPRQIPSDAGWRCLEIGGPLPFAMAGPLAAVAGPLAAARVAMFTLSTYDTDYVLVKEHALYAAVEALRRAGHEVALPDEPGD